MRNLTLDLDALAVDSFSTIGDPSKGATGLESTGCHTYAFCMEAQNGGVADTFVCAGVAALTEAYPCKTTR